MGNHPSSPCFRFMAPILAGYSPSGDGFAQPFQQAFQVRHALTQLVDFAA